MKNAEVWCFNKEPNCTCVIFSYGDQPDCCDEDGNCTCDGEDMRTCECFELDGEE